MNIKVISEPEETKYSTLSPNVTSHNESITYDPQLTSEPRPQTQLGRHHTEFSIFEEEYIRNYITLADTKAAFLFTIAAGIIGFIFGSDSIRHRITDQFYTIPSLILSLAVLCCAAVATLSFWVIAPRLSASSNEGVVFFGAVAGKETSDDYVREVSRLSEDDLNIARLKHCHDTARICARKYNILTKSIWLIPPCSALLLVSIIFAEPNGNSATAPIIEQQIMKPSTSQ